MLCLDLLVLWFSACESYVFIYTVNLVMSSGMDYRKTLKWLLSKTRSFAFLNKKGKDVVDLVLCALTLMRNWTEHAHIEFTTCQKYNKTTSPRVPDISQNFVWFNEYNVFSWWNRLLSYLTRVCDRAGCVMGCLGRALVFQGGYHRRKRTF